MGKRTKRWKRKKVSKNPILYHGTDAKQKPATIYVRLKVYPGFWLGDDTTLYNEKTEHFSSWTAREGGYSYSIKGEDGRWNNASALRLFEDTFDRDHCIVIR